MPIWKISDCEVSVCQAYVLNRVWFLCHSYFSPAYRSAISLRDLFLSPDL